jgi:hypothetical protein
MSTDPVSDLGYMLAVSYNPTSSITYGFLHGHDELFLTAIKDSLPKLQSLSIHPLLPLTFVEEFLHGVFVVACRDHSNHIAAIQAEVNPFSEQNWRAFQKQDTEHDEWIRNMLIPYEKGATLERHLESGLRACKNIKNFIAEVDKSPGLGQNAGRMVEVGAILTDILFMVEDGYKSQLNWLRQNQKVSEIQMMAVCTISYFHNSLLLRRFLGTAHL